MTTPIPPEWRTHAESTDYRETPNYDDTIAFARRLAHASSIIEYEGFGFSGQGRELPLIIASETGTFTPVAAKSEGKAVVAVAWNATDANLANSTDANAVNASANNSQ